ncbi:MAG TPA: patatin-like phospholipase family protein [Acidimicrobiales bacterium]|nr:patatin-like phospholipase family protein [Acidimicrobiales bacterium]
MGAAESLSLRQSLPGPVCFVFGGGGSLGAVQVGMMQALSEQMIAPDLVIGTSVGSLNGAFVAQDPKGATNRLSHIWSRITREQVFPGGILSQARTLQHSKTHLFPNSGLAKLIDEFLGAGATFEELELPCAAVTTEIETASPHVLKTGPLQSALLASTAIPGIFPPIERDGRAFYDGGVVSNVPLRQALDMGARSLVVLDCNFPGHELPEPESLPEVILFTAMVTMRSQAQHEAPLVASHVPVVYIPGPTAHRISPLNFEHTQHLIERSYDAARPFLDNLKIEGPGLYGPSS